MDKVDYLEYLSSHQNDIYWLDILNTSYDMLPHKLEILNSEILKNKYEIKKVVIENLDDYLSSKDTAVKMTVEIEKNKSYIKNVSELLNQEKMSKIQSDSSFYNDIFSFLTNNTLMFETENLIKIVMKKGNEEYLGKLIDFLNKTSEMLASSRIGKKKIFNHFEKIKEKIRLVLMDKILIMKHKEINSSNELIPVNPLLYFNLKQEDLANELFKKDFQKNVFEKLEKLRPYRANSDYLVKIFYIYNKSLQKSLQKLMKLFDCYSKKNEEQKVLLHELTNFQRICGIFEKNFNSVIKYSCEDQAFFELLQFCTNKSSCQQSFLAVYLQNLIENQLQKLCQKFLSKLKILIRYSYFNNLFMLLLKKVDNNSFEELWNILNDSKIQKSEKFQKIIMFTRKNEILSLIYNDVLTFYQFFSFYLKDNAKITVFHQFVIENLKEFVSCTKKFLEPKKLMKEEEKNKIIIKLEKFLDIIFFLIKNNYLFP